MALLLKQPELQLPVGTEPDGKPRLKKVILMPVESVTTVTLVAELAGNNETLAKHCALALSLPKDAKQALRLPPVSRLKHDYGALGHLLSDRLMKLGMSYKDVSIASAVAFNFVLQQAIRMGLIPEPSEDAQDDDGEAVGEVEAKADFSAAPDATTS